MAFFNALVIHGLAPNLSGRARRINTFSYNVNGNGGGARSGCGAQDDRVAISNAEHPITRVEVV